MSYFSIPTGVALVLVASVSVYTGTSVKRYLKTSTVYVEKVGDTYVIKYPEKLHNVIEGPPPVRFKLKIKDE